jgi:hypothetical protein
MVFRLGDIAGIPILLNRLYRTVRRETREARESAGFRGGLSKVCGSSSLRRSSCGIVRVYIPLVKRVTAGF